MADAEIFLHCHQEKKNTFLQQEKKRFSNAFTISSLTSLGQKFMGSRISSPIHQGGIECSIHRKLWCLYIMTHCIAHKYFPYSRAVHLVLQQFRLFCIKEINGIP